MVNRYTKDMRRPIVSIIIPIYNASSSIGNIVNKILRQSLPDFELLLVDDGSSDSSLNIIENLASSDRRIRVYAKPNGGPSSARNLGLRYARGEYIQFYDSDDNIISSALSCIVQAIQEDDADVLISGWDIVHEGKRKTISMSPKATIVDNDIINYTLHSLGQDGTLYNLWNKLFKADIIRQHAIRFREDVNFGEDLIFALEYFKYAKKIKLISKTTYIYHTGREASLFRTSSIVPEYRYINDAALRSFTGHITTEKTRDLFQWVRWRWLLSYWMIVARSNKSLRNKLLLIKRGASSNMVVAKSQRYIGRTAYILEFIMSRAVHRPIIALLFGRLLSSIKRISLVLR